MNSDRPSPAKHGVIVEDLSTIICMIWHSMFKHMHIIPQSQCVLYIQNGTGETRIQLHTVQLKIFFIFKILLIQKTTFVQTYQNKVWVFMLESASICVSVSVCVCHCAALSRFVSLGDACQLSLGLPAVHGRGPSLPVWFHTVARRLQWGQQPNRRLSI